MQEHLTLPPRLDMAAAAALWQRIASTQGDVILDGTALHHLGAAGLQVLLMTDRLARQGRRNFRLTDLRPELRGMLAAANLSALVVDYAEEVSA